MLGRSSYRIAYEHEDSLYRLTRVVYGADGSYYVMAPVPPTEQANFAMLTVNYERQAMSIPVREAVDLAAASEEDKEIKLSHHPSGFVQFSGAGLVSGRADDGTIRGMGVMSWPLTQSVEGPAFGLVINHFESLLNVTSAKQDALVFESRDVAPLPGFTQLVLEGHYFPGQFRRFVWEDDRGEKLISVSHPNGAVLHLRALLPPDDCVLDSFLALELYTEKPPPELLSEPGFIFCGSTGNLRRNENNELLGDGIYCFYPVDALDGLRSVDYVPQPPPREPNES